MDELLLLLVLFFAAYQFVPKAWFSWLNMKRKSAFSVGPSQKKLPLIPEDSMLRRHYITQLRSEIELELCPRPTDSALKRHYESLVDAELNNRLATLTA